MVNHVRGDVEEHLEANLANDFAYLAEVGASRKIRTRKQVLYQSSADVVTPVCKSRESRVSDEVLHVLPQASLSSSKHGGRNW